MQKRAIEQFNGKAVKKILNSKSSILIFKVAIYPLLVISGASMISVICAGKNAMSRWEGRDPASSAYSSGA